MSTARARRPFRYVDDDPLDEPEILDEQEQDDLIRQLAAQNQRRNEQFRQLLVAVPVLAMVPFVVACVSPSSSSAASAMLPLLGITSLAATAYLLHSQPTAWTGIAVLDAWSGAASGPPSASSAGRPVDLASPLHRHLPVLNVGLCAMLLLSLFLPRGSTATSGASASFYILASLPAAVYAVALIAKTTMAGVDPERELSRLRYEYKGA